MKTAPLPLTSLDLKHGALGFDRVNRRQIVIKPCGKPPDSYVGWCHIIITSWPADESNGDGTVRRTVKAVHETEIVDWLHMPGGIDADRFEWYLGSWEPRPDTYLVDKLHAEDALKQAARDERARKKEEREAKKKAKAERAAARKAATEEFFRAALPAPKIIDG